MQIYFLGKQEEAESISLSLSHTPLSLLNKNLLMLIQICNGCTQKWICAHMQARMQASIDRHMYLDADIFPFFLDYDCCVCAVIFK